MLQLQHIICIWDSLSCIGYICMTIMICSSYFIPTLNDLASHGKTRMSSSSSSSTTSADRATTASSSSSSSNSTSTNHHENPSTTATNSSHHENRKSSTHGSTNVIPATTSNRSHLGAATTTSNEKNHHLHINSNSNNTNKSLLQQCSCLISSALYYFNHNEMFLVKKKYFRQFYIMGILYLTMVLLYHDTTTFTATKSTGSTTTMQPLLVPKESHSSFTKVSIVLLYLHLFRRLYECTHVHVWNETSKMHIAGYLVGLIHYIWLPHVFIRLPCSKICCQDDDNENESLLLLHTDGVSQRLQTQHPFLLRCIHFIPQWLDEQSMRSTRRHHRMSISTTTSTNRIDMTTDQIRFLFAVVLCLYGQYQQYRHHVLLANLRNHQTSTTTTTTSTTHQRNSTNGTGPKTDEDKQNGDGTATIDAATTKNYSLPTSGWFQYVTCPHYLAEIIIYTSFALLLEEEKYTTNGRSTSSSSTTNGDDHQTYDNDNYYYGYRHVLVVLWVASNLIMSALINHEWYMKHLSDTAHHNYQVKHKKAIVPFLL